MRSLCHGVRQTGMQWTCFRSWNLITFPTKLIYSQLSHWTNESSHVSLIRPDVQYLNSSWLLCFGITPKGESGTRSLGTLAYVFLSLPLSKLFCMCLWFSCGWLCVHGHVVCAGAHPELCTSMYVEAGCWHSWWFSVYCCMGSHSAWSLVTQAGLANWLVPGIPVSVSGVLGSQAGWHTCLGPGNPNSDSHPCGVLYLLKHLLSPLAVLLPAHLGAHLGAWQMFEAAHSESQVPQGKVAEKSTDLLPEEWKILCQNKDVSRGRVGFDK